MVDRLRCFNRRSSVTAARFRCCAVVAALFCECSAPGTASRYYVPAERTFPATSLVASAWTNTARGPEQLDSGEQLVRLTLGDKQEAARRLVRQFFDALASGDPDHVLGLFAPNATAYDYGGRERSLSDYWNRRLAKFDYSMTADFQIAWLPDLVVLDRRHVSVSELPAPLRTSTDVWFVLVPIQRTHIDDQQLFGQEIWFRLRWGSRGLRISGYLEDFVPD